MSKTYQVEGMTCGGCVRSLTAALQAALPDLSFEVKLEGGTLQVEGDHDARAIEQAVEDAGYRFAGPQ